MRLDSLFFLALYRSFYSVLLLRLFVFLDLSSCSASSLLYIPSVITVGIACELGGEIVGCYKVRLRLGKKGTWWGKKNILVIGVSWG